MATAGMVNVGQLVRERHGADGVVLVQFGGYRGSVLAGAAWGAPVQRLPVPPALDRSVEALLNEAGCDRALFVFPTADQPGWLRSVRDHRAIGVVYDPARERAATTCPQSWVAATTPSVTSMTPHALTPLHGEPAQPAGERATYPTGR
jgi:erythromycin esterase-like protein